MDDIQLTPSAITRMCHSDSKPERPIVQVLNWKAMPKPEGGGSPRIRLALSDGDHHSKSCMAASQINNRILNGGLDNNDVISLDNYLVNKLQGKQVVVVVDYSVLSHPGFVIKGRDGREPQLLSDDDQHVLPPPPRPPAHYDQPSAVLPPTQPIFEAHPRPQPSRRSEAPIQRTGAMGGPSGPGSGCHPISSLTPYQNKWKIRARVTKKMAMKRFNNSRGEGKLFSVELLDETGEIRATGFNEDADRFFNLLQEDNTYYISGGKVKAANKNFTSIKNDYELTFSSGTEISLCTDTAGTQNIPRMSFNFITIDKLANCPKNTVTDVIGVLKAVEDAQHITSKKGEDLTKRDLTLLDNSKSSIQLTIWGNDAESFEGKEGDVLAVKGCRVGDFGGVSLTTTQGARVHINPDIEAAHRLKGWFDLHGCNETTHHLTAARGTTGGSRNEPAKLIAVVDLLKLGSDANMKSDYFSVRGTISFIRPNESLYKACMTENCKKKVVEQSGRYRCEKCQMDFDDHKHGFIMNLQISDFTGSLNVTLFEDQGKKLLGMDANQLGHLRNSNESAWKAVYDGVMFKKFLFRIGAKTEHYNDEVRIKYRCVDVQPMDFEREIRELETLIPKMERMSGPAASAVSSMDTLM